jgi:cysteine-rich repeat protein
MKKNDFIQDAGLIVGALIVGLIIIIGSNYVSQIDKTGEAFMFTSDENVTIYNFLAGVSMDSEDYRFVVPDDASPQLVSAISGLSSQLNFNGSATITESELALLSSNQKNYLIHFTKNGSQYGLTEPQISIIETSSSLKLIMGSPDELSFDDASAIEGIRILSNYELYSDILSTSCVRPNGTSCEYGSFCGNEVVESDEECDEGNLNEGDNCSNLCEIIYQSFIDIPRDNIICDDTQDGGENYYKKASTTYTDFNPGGIVYFNNSDVCIGNELLERTCNPYGINEVPPFYAGIKYLCPNGCSDGACRQYMELVVYVDSQNNTVLSKECEIGDGSTTCSLDNVSQENACSNLSPFTNAGISGDYYGIVTSYTEGGISIEGPVYLFSCEFNDANIVNNGDFDINHDGWFRGGGSVSTVSVENGVAKIYVTAPSEGNCWPGQPNPSHCNSLIQRFTNDKPYKNRSFKLKADFKAAEGVTGSLELWASPWGANLKSSRKSISGNGNWQTIELDVLELDDAQDYILDLRIVSLAPDASGTVTYWDNVELVEVFEDDDITCTDSDGGESYNAQGFMNFNGTTYIDYCWKDKYDNTSNQNMLREYSCTLNQTPLDPNIEGYGFGDFYEINYNCPNGCSDGACVEETDVTCTDSDGGINYSVRGNATGYYNNFETYGSIEDACCQNINGGNCGDHNGIPEYNLVEMYCSELEIKENHYNCPNGCLDGACVDMPPVDGQCGTTHYNCLSGLSMNAQSTDSQWIWICSGVNGGSSASCSEPKPIDEQCGDGNVTGGEECDDGNTVNGDGCSSICLIEQESIIHVSSLIQDVKSNPTQFKQVIGSTAVKDNIAAIDIAGFTGIQDTVDDNTQTTVNDDIIVIGGPCVNKMAAELLGLSPGTCGPASGIPENKGIIKTFTNDGKKQILIAGWESLDTRMAAQVIVRYSEFINQMNESEVITFGTSLDDIGVGTFETVKIKPMGDSTITLEAPLKDYDVQLDIATDVNQDGFFDVVGSSMNKLIITQTSGKFEFNQDTDEWFIATYKSGSVGETHVLEVSDIDDMDGITVKDYAGNTVASNKKTEDTFDVGELTFVVMGYSEVRNTVNLSGHSVTDNIIITKEGLQIELPSIGNVSSISSLIVIEKDGSGNIGVTETTHVDVGFSADNEAMVKSVSLLFYEIGNTDVFEAFTDSARWLWDKTTDQYDLEVQYHYK